MNNPLAEDLDHVLQHTAGLWDEFRGQRVFLAGGTGFIGCWLLESLLWANDRFNLGVRVTLLSRDPGRFRRKAPHLADNGAVHLVQGDVKSFVFPEGSFSHVIHAATESSTIFRDRDPLSMAATIIDGTRHVLTFVVNSGAKELLFISSGAVYGRQPAALERIPEEFDRAPDPEDPSATYGLAKRMAEHLCVLHAAQGGFEAKIARCFAFHGPYLPLDGHFAIGNFLRDALAGGPIIVKGDGTSVRSYLYAADLVIWLYSILCRGVSARAYNVGGETPVSISDLAVTVAKAVHSPGQVVIEKTGLEIGSAGRRYVPSTGRARQELALEERISLREGIERSACYLSRLKDGGRDKRRAEA